jgi:hypothetical protein
MASTKALLRSMLPSKRSTKPLDTSDKGMTRKETPAESSARKAVHAEATYHALR